MFDDTVFAFPSKDVFQGVLFGGFIPRLSEAGENATEKNALVSKSTPFNNALKCRSDCEEKKKNMQIVQVP